MFILMQINIILTFHSYECTLCSKIQYFIGAARSNKLIGRGCEDEFKVSGVE